MALMFGFFLFSCSLWMVRTQAEVVCTSTEKTSTVRFTLKSFQNQTGQWSSEVGLKHNGNALEVRKTDPWTVDLEHNATTTCEGDEVLSIVATLTVPSARAPKKVTPPNYNWFPNVGYYKFHPEALVWEAARQKCGEEGAHLVIINTENEANVMKQLFFKFKHKVTNSTRKDFMWVGIYEQGINNNYLTVFGDLLSKTGFSRWSPGDPNLPGANDCIVLFELNVGLVDVKCADLYAFVCEIPEPK